MPRHDGYGSNSNSDDSLYVASDELARDGQYIHEPADRIEALIEWYEAGRRSLGAPPWGEGDDFAKQMNNVMQPLEENLMLYLRILSLGLRQASDGTVATARNYRATEEHNIDAVRRLDGSAPEDGGARR
ncbi:MULTISPECIES: hypothetical protein [Nocardiopsis]|uniref:hypothetical protein n=1 Tax=Nocardiopsis TaxID=2013 RepID=UPI000361129D|nr:MULTISPECIES: hypothetical protein [Nocardiopsis]ASU58861.1 hypothetical protein CGQ36_15395 [Nocardiopsis dassonvillei]